MKTIHLILLLSLFSLPLLASQSTSTTTDCRLNTLAFTAEVTLVQQIKEDLLNGIWHQQTAVPATLLFAESGVGSFITDCPKGGKEIGGLQWSVTTENGQVILTLTKQTEGIVRYDVKQTCDGLTLQDISNGQFMTLAYQPVSKATKMLNVQRTLSGEWSSTVYPNTVIEDLEAESQQQIMSAYFTYELSNDGTFVRTFGGHNLKTVSVSGIWQVSEDGNYIILHLPDGKGGYYNRVAEIKHLAMDELVLDQPFGVSELESRLCAEMRTFYFNKQ